MKKNSNSLKHKPSVLSVSSCVILTAYVIVLFAIMLWAVVFSLTDFNEDIFFSKSRRYLVFPSKLNWGNYQKVYDFYTIIVEAGAGTRGVFLPEMFLNSILYALGTAFAGALAPCIMGYVAGRFRFHRLVGFIDAIVLVTMVLPVVGSLPSQVRIIYGLGLNDSFFGLWIMAFGFANMYYFVCKAMFKGIPMEISEAAHIDGAGNFQIMVRVILPLAVPTFLSVMLLMFVSAWNNYTTALVFAPNKPTAAYGLFIFIQNTRVSEPTLKMAGAMLLMGPILLLFIFLNKKLMGNVTLGSVKG